MRSGGTEHLLPLLAETKSLLTAIGTGLGTLQQPGLLQEGDQLGDGGARDAGPSCELAGRTPARVKLLEREVLSYGQRRIVLGEQTLDPAAHLRGDSCQDGGSAGTPGRSSTWRHLSYLV